ncbi:MAG TPA: histidinol-phosphate transaminase [Opitutaceae bacterium]|nr:histidinol-phosphate transaminase [Opitutaceae bacterium]HND62067.1 histidinol-phosphate transaminase [Opitutaceae bacterium]
MPTPKPLSRRQWLLTSGTALAGLALSARFLNEEMRAQVTNERLQAVAPVRARLSLNENPLGPSPLATQAMIQHLQGGRASRYPYAETNELTNLLAAKEGVRPEQIVLGVGSGEVLETVGLHIGLLKGEVIYATPGYLQMIRSVEAAGGRAVGVPVNARLEHDLDAMAARAVAPNSVVYVANPHNPTGTAVAPDALRAFVRAVASKALVFIDEAYLDFADDTARHSVVDLVHEQENLVVARTFSKIYGLAALRVGYGVTNVRLAAKLSSYGLGTPNGPGIVGAIASLRDEPYVPAMRARVVAERDKLVALLRQLGRRYAEPQTNFVFFHTGRPHKEVFDRMLAESVSIARAFPPMLDWARISIGTPEENELARTALQKVLGPA